MSTPIEKIKKIMDTLKSPSSIYVNVSIPYDYCVLGVTQASIPLGKDFNIDEVDNGDGTKTYTIKEVMTTKEIYLAGLYSYRNYFLGIHQDMDEKAVNFKTINFAVTGLTERAKEAMRIVWWCDTQINNTLDLLGIPIGTANEMKGDWNGEN
jgi:hypothetical protein